MEPVTLRPVATYHGAEDAPALAPRQGVLVPERPGRVVFEAGMDLLALRDLGGFSHVWLVFLFDRAKDWKPLVLPPHRRTRRGVFATRSPYRPNPIGLSAVRLERVEGRTLHVKGARST